MRLYYSMDNRYLTSRATSPKFTSYQLTTRERPKGEVDRDVHFVNSDIPNFIRHIRRVHEKQDITPVKRWFHRSPTLYDTSHFPPCISPTHSLKRKCEKDDETYDRTTTMGLSEFVNRQRPFHIISPEATTVKKLSAWKSIYFPPRSSIAKTCRWQERGENAAHT